MSARPVRLLHTADWHVGKGVRGHPRADEHEAVLAELAGLADEHAVDVVLVVGDLFDTAAPTAEAERIVYRGLLALAAGGRHVVVVAGNHDNARRLEAVAPVFASSRVQVHSRVRRPDDGGVVHLDVGGVAVRLAVLPFVSQRGIVGVDDLMAAGGAEHNLLYADRLARVVATLCAEPDPAAVNVLAAHAMVAGGVLGGGERSAHTIFEYALSATALPGALHYVALGHLHRTQQIPAGCPAWYPGSPLQLDFGEAGNDPHALLVEAAPGAPAQVTALPLRAGRRFRTVRGSLAELTAQVVEGDDAFVRVVVEEPARVGLADEVRQLFPDAVEITVARSVVAAPDGDGTDDGGHVPSPHEQFAAYLAANDVADDRLVALFDELLDEVAGAT